MFYNRLNKNLDFLSEFLIGNCLGENFTCNFDLTTKQSQIDIDCEAFIFFNKSKREVEILVSCILEDELPISFNMKVHDFDVEYGILSIYGKNGKIGAYKAVITPYKNIT
jgi:hypothetical protein